MDLGLEGKTALIAGGPGWSSFGIASAFKREGARAVLCLAGDQPEPCFADAVYRCDLSDHGVAECFCAELDSRFGGVDVFVFEHTDVEETGLLHPDAESIRRRLLPARAAFVCCRVFARHMAGRRGGSLLFVTTLHDEKPNGSDMAHSVAAGMIQNLVMEAALEYGEAGVRVNQVAAGALEGSAERFPSDFATFYEGYRHKVPIGRLGTAEDVADLAVFLSSSRAGFINGARVRVDGGYLLHYLDQKANYRALKGGL